MCFPLQARVAVTLSALVVAGLWSSVAGTLADLNQAVADGVLYHPTASGDDTLSITVADGFGGSDGAEIPIQAPDGISIADAVAGNVSGNVNGEQVNLFATKLVGDYGSFGYSVARKPPGMPECR